MTQLRGKRLTLGLEMAMGTGGVSTVSASREVELSLASGTAGWTTGAVGAGGGVASFLGWVPMIPAARSFCSRSLTLGAGAGVGVVWGVETAAVTDIDGTPVLGTGARPGMMDDAGAGMPPIPETSQATHYQLL